MKPISSVLLLSLLLALPLPAGAEEGEALFRSECAPCHGVYGRGDGPDAGLLASRPRDLRGGFLRPYRTADLVAKILQGRALPVQLNQAALRARAQETESVIVFLRRIPSIDWNRIESGELIYSVRCTECHELTGKPVASPPPGVAAPRDLGDPRFQRDTSDAELMNAVRHGRARMPALVPRVPEADAGVLAAYVRVLSPGYTSYERFCMSCHGTDGRGVGTLGEEMPLPTTVFDAAYFERTDPEALRARVWHMIGEHVTQMPHYRWVLSDAEARALATYMKSAWGAEDRADAPGSAGFRSATTVSSPAFSPRPR